MKVLFIGGTGNLSFDCTLRALDKGIEVFHLNRGTRPERVPEGVVSLSADARDEAAVFEAVKEHSFDAVVDFIAFLPEQVEADLRVFRGRAAQYVFISSASAYRKPPVSHVITEATPLENPYWKYSRDKIACEEVIREAERRGEIQATIVRPSHTYGIGWLPAAFGSSDFTIARRMLDGREIIVHGDGQSLWTLTHARDFAVGLVGLLGNPAALGEAVQIMGDEVLTWEAIHRTIAAGLGVEPKIVHIPSDYIARVDPEMGAHLLGDKTWSSVFDCSKLKRLVPEFRTTVGFHEGVRESLDYYRADPSRERTNPELDATMDRILGAWRKATLSTRI
jgi:nucleoside-diphosphate-sugar epimerase